MAKGREVDVISETCQDCRIRIISLCCPQIRASCQLARAALNLSGSLVRPGVTTDHIDEVVRNYILEQGAYPSPLNFKGFPKSISCSGWC